MNLLIDTHALLWFLTNDKRLSPKTKTRLEQADKVFIPTIVLLELLYLLQKKRKVKSFPKILTRLKNGNQFVIVSLDTAVVEKVFDIPENLEMHDRIILATAKLLGITIITKDKTISKEYSKIIWK